MVRVDSLSSVMGTLRHFLRVSHTQFPETETAYFTKHVVCQIVIFLLALQYVLKAYCRV